MKTNKRILFTVLLPLLATSSAFAENDAAAEATTVASNTGAMPATQSANALPSPASKSRATSWRASEIIGTNVKNAADETVGEIEDLIVEWSSREVIGVVISTGGFLGVADNLTSVSLSSLKYDGGAKVFRTSLTKTELEKEPRLSAKAWPDVSQENAYEQFRAARDKVGGDVTAPDNTAQNEKDMKEDTVTPMDQGNNESDLKLTKDIRMAVVNTDVSFNAKNIKIITNGGSVTLRGVVESAAEHTSVLKTVHTYASPDKVTDELKVNTK